MMRIALLLVVASACGNRTESAMPGQPARAEPVPADASVPVPAITASHSGAIALLAVSDDGKAVISADENGELRFWPSLDGLHEPVALRGRAPTGLVLARNADGFVAGLLDQAGGVEVVQLAATGTTHARRVIAAEPAIEELAATSTMILARRSDETIQRIDASSQPLAPQIGEQILGIAARRNVALAAIADPEHAGEIHQVRQIALGRDLAWGVAYTLPVPLKAPIAVSPSGRRVAGLDARSGAGTIIDLFGQPRVIASDIVGDSEDGTIGFLDDERAVFRGGIVVPVPAVTAAVDPWSATRATQRLRIGRDAAVADGIVVSGHGTNLILADSSNTLFLGYRDIGTGVLRVTPNVTTFAIGTRVLWLDDDLHDRRARDITNDSTGGVPVDDHRLLKGTYTYLEDNRSKLDVALVDASSGLEVQLGSWSQSTSVAYDPTTRVLAVTGYTRTVPRFSLDAEAAKVTPLRPLKTLQAATVELFDPNASNGIVAISTGYDGDHFVHETFVDDHKSTTTPITPAWTTRIPNGSPIGFDRDGAIYTIQPKGLGTQVVVYRGGKEARRWQLEPILVFNGGAVDHAGTQVVTFTTSALMMTDANGHERWRLPMWAVNAVKFSEDGTKLIVNTGGGLVTLDAATGARLATACGWGFGLSTTEPSISIYNTPVICAEALR